MFFEVIKDTVEEEAAMLGDTEAVDWWSPYGLWTQKHSRGVLMFACAVCIGTEFPGRRPALHKTSARQTDQETRRDGGMVRRPQV